MQKRDVQDIYQKDMSTLEIFSPPRVSSKFQIKLKLRFSFRAEFLGSKVHHVLNTRPLGAKTLGVPSQSVVVKVLTYYSM